MSERINIIPIGNALSTLKSGLHKRLSETQVLRVLTERNRGGSTSELALEDTLRPARWLMKSANEVIDGNSKGKAVEALGLAAASIPAMIVGLCMGFLVAETRHVANIAQNTLDAIRQK